MNTWNRTTTIVLTALTLGLTACQKEEASQPTMANIPASGNGYIRFKLDGVQYVYDMGTVGYVNGVSGSWGLSLVAYTLNGTAQIWGNTVQLAADTVPFPNSAAPVVFEVTTGPGGNASFVTWADHTTGAFIFTTLTTEQAIGTFHFDNVIRTNDSGDLVDDGHVISDGEFNIALNH